MEMTLFGVAPMSNDFMHTVHTLMVTWVTDYKHIVFVTFQTGNNVRQNLNFYNLG